MNSPPIAQFMFSNVVLRNQKYKKEKLQCTQNLALNPTCDKCNVASFLGLINRLQ